LEKTVEQLSECLQKLENASYEEVRAQKINIVNVSKLASTRLSNFLTAVNHESYLTANDASK